MTVRSNYIRVRMVSPTDGDPLNIFRGNNAVRLLAQ
jgi:hypothetical protein